MIISFVNQKGGSGKTTLAVNTAACLTRLGYKVLLIDADKQASATAWAGLREEPAFQVVGMARDNMAKEAIRLATDFSATIIDGPPHAETVARSCIIASDFVALPIEPSGLSTWASDLTIRQVREAQEYKGTLKCGFVVSRKIGNTVIGRDIRGLATTAGIPVLDAEIEQRVAFAESMTMGRTIFEWAANGPAASEVETLTNELIRHVEKDLHDGSKTESANG